MCLMLSPRPCMYGMTICASTYAMGSTSYQIQNGKPKLIAYASKRLPGAAKNYSIRELEMYGLAINITILLIY